MFWWIFSLPCLRESCMFRVLMHRSSFHLVSEGVSRHRSAFSCQPGVCLFPTQVVGFYVHLISQRQEVRCRSTYRRFLNSWVLVSIFFPYLNMFLGSLGLYMLTGKRMIKKNLEIIGEGKKILWRKKTYYDSSGTFVPATWMEYMDRLVLNNLWPLGLVCSWPFCVVNQGTILSRDSLTHWAS
jgi:hypothetical protein